MSGVSFTKQELERYSRHLVLPGFSLEGQQKLKSAKVLVVGSGGLGAPVLLYLAAAGVGNIGIIDFDVVEESNLQRQVLFNIEDVGKAKAELAAKHLRNLNPHIKVDSYNEKLGSDNALEIIKNYDVVADGSDNFATRYLVNDACVLLNKVLVFASIFRFEGQLSVFNYVDEKGQRGPNYRDIFPVPPDAGSIPSCSEGGVLGVLPGIIGSMQANEVIKVICGIGEPLVGKLHLFDALRFESRNIKFSRDSNNPLNGDNPSQTTLINYELFCGVNEHKTKNKVVKEISVQELAQWQKDGKDFQLIDVREPFEYEICNLKGELIPLQQVSEAAKRIETDKDVVIHCRSGKRSADAISFLEQKFGFTNLYNLRGGILEYADVIDQSLEKY